MTDLFVRMVIPILPASLQKILKIGGGAHAKMACNCWISWGQAESPALVFLNVLMPEMDRDIGVRVVTVGAACNVVAAKRLGAGRGLRLGQRYWDHLPCANCEASYSANWISASRKVREVYLDVKGGKRTSNPLWPIGLALRKGSFQVGGQISRVFAAYGQAN